MSQYRDPRAARMAQGMGAIGAAEAQQLVDRRLVELLTQVERNGRAGLELRLSELDAARQAAERNQAVPQRTGQPVTLRANTNLGILNAETIFQSVPHTAPMATFSVGLDSFRTPGNAPFNVVLEITYGTASGFSRIELDMGRGSQVTFPADTSTVKAWVENEFQSRGTLFAPFDEDFEINLNASLTCGVARAARSYVTRSFATRETEINLNIPRSAYALNVFGDGQSALPWYATGSVEFYSSTNYQAIPDAPQDPGEGGLILDGISTVEGSAFANLTGEGVKIPGSATGFNLINPDGGRVVAMFALNV